MMIKKFTFSVATTSDFHVLFFFCPVLLLIEFHAIPFSSRRKINFFPEIEIYPPHIERVFRVPNSGL